MENAQKFRDKLARGQVCLGPVITCTDATITEALCSLYDFVWIDTEHNAMSLETVQAHLMATKGSEVAALVRVRWNDPALIKPVLDIGADGVIVPFVRSVDDVRRAVAACRYPPDGIRGFGPRRASGYGRLLGPDFARRANATVIVIAQIEHIDAANAIDEIVQLPGLTGVVLGPQDLSGSMGLLGQTNHPEVVAVMERVITAARRAGLFAGQSIGGGPEAQAGWVRRGAQWLSVGNDMGFLMEGARQQAGGIRQLVAGPAAKGAAQ
ncbi:MAG: hypothetical protein IT317_06360 [Anaerolineales bacterium]|nr:hypothetical protein [Anaerolineales bacterium]